MDSIKKRGRYAGLLYFLLGITGPIGLVYVPGKLIVSGDATATASNLRSSESLLRLGMASDLFGHVLLIYLVLALYRLFKDVNQTKAVQLAILGALVSIPIMFIAELNYIAALILAKGAPFLATFSRPQLDSLSYLFVRLHGQCVVLASIFWGLWLFPFGSLCIRSGFIPRAIGVLLWIAGIGYLVDAFFSLVMPQNAHLIGQFGTICEVGELPIIFWLLIWGAKERPGGARIEAPAS